jgi:ribokinase
MIPPQGALLSLGSIDADFQVRLDDLAGFGNAGTPGRDLVRLSGGKGGNVAVLARRLGCAARLLGRVGEDDLAVQALATPRAEGVDLSGVVRVTGCQTGLALLGVGPDGDKRSVSAGEANEGFRPDDIDAMAEAVRGAPAGSVLVADYEITPAACSAAIAAARQRSFPIVVDPSFPSRVEARDLPSVSVLTPNEREARALAKCDEHEPLDAVARRLGQLGARSVCIKTSSGGCLLLHERELWRHDAQPVTVVDTSGAGDAFTGTIGVALLRGMSLPDAVTMAVAMTELVVGVYGAQRSYPSRAQLEAHMATRRNEPATRLGWAH